MTKIKYNISMGIISFFIIIIMGIIMPLMEGRIQPFSFIYYLSLLNVAILLAILGGLE